MPEQLTPDGSSAQSARQPYTYSTRPASRGPQTVINPERRPSPAADEVAPQPDPSVWRRLFPVEGDPEAAANSDREAGCELGHFLIEERIGAGGMGAVFRAIDKRLQRVVALKVMSPSQAQYAGTLQRFQNEARAAARLDHDNIARVYYIGEDHGLQFIAYEFVTGTNVRDLIHTRGRLAPTEAVNYVLQIAAALNHTYAAGVVHRDIKPSNIIVAPTGRAKLVDLGLARKQWNEDSLELTTAGTTLGTFDYIAPEQAKDPRSVDVRSDIYSLGCTLYHMLTGEPPYPEGTVLQKLLDHQGKATPDPSAKNPSVSPELSAIVRKMMSSDPDRRYATPDELIRDLMGVAFRLGLRGINPDGLVWTPSRTVRQPFWERYAGVIATTAILLLVVFVLNRYPDIRQRAEQITAGEPKFAPHNAAESFPIAPAAADAPAADSAAPDRANTATQTAVVATAQTSGETSAAGLDAADDFSGSESADETRDATQVADRSNGPLRRGLDDISPLVDPDEYPTLEELAREPLVAEKPQDIEKKSAAAPGTSDVVATAPAPAPERRGVLTLGQIFSLPIDQPPAISILSKDDSPPRTYDTLEAACADAADNSTIELRFNGPRTRKERPVVIGNKFITIRGARGFRPLLEFEPLTIPDQGAQTRMFAVNGGSLELNNLDVQISVRDDVATDGWALFALSGSDSVRLKGVTISVSNFGNRPMAVFELGSPAGRAVDMDMMDQELPIASSGFSLSLSECIVRGGTSLIAAPDAHRGRVEVSQSLLALDEPLLDLDSQAVMAVGPAELELQIEHATCVLGAGLLRVQSDDESSSPQPVRITARSNVFTTLHDVPLVSMSGATDARDLRQTLYFVGVNNFYDRFKTFWRVETQSPLGDGATLDYDYQAWTSHWGSASTGGANEAELIWSGRPIGKPLVEFEPDDVILNRTRFSNPAIEAASDGTDAGVDHRRLPPLPTSP